MIRSINANALLMGYGKQLQETLFGHLFLSNHRTVAIENTHFSPPKLILKFHRCLQEILS